MTEALRGSSAQRSLPRDGERTELRALTLPLDVERTETVRPGPSGSADHAGLHAQGRVAVPTTRAPGAWGTGETSRPRHVGPFSSGVPGKMPQATRTAGRSRVTRPFPGATDRAGCRERRESDERREAPECTKRAWLKREESPAGRQREAREGPAPGRSHTGCDPGLPDGRGDANAAQKSMSTLLKISSTLSVRIISSSVMRPASQKSEWAVKRLSC